MSLGKAHGRGRERLRCVNRSGLRSPSPAPVLPATVSLHHRLYKHSQPLPQEVEVRIRHHLAQQLQHVHPITGHRVHLYRGRYGWGDSVAAVCLDPDLLLHHCLGHYLPSPLGKWNRQRPWTHLWDMKTSNSPTVLGFVRASMQSPYRRWGVKAAQSASPVSKVQLSTGMRFSHVGHTTLGRGPVHIVGFPVGNVSVHQRLEELAMVRHA